MEVVGLDAADLLDHLRRVAREVALEDLEDAPGGFQGGICVRAMAGIPAVAMGLAGGLAFLMGGGRCAGVLLDDGRAIRARATIITAGGAAALWSRTTNPPGSTGAGMVLAHRAGARLADLEFLQFHPTAVTGIPRREGFLVTEAIRGEGATLHGPDGGGPDARLPRRASPRRAGGAGSRDRARCAPHPRGSWAGWRPP